MTKTIINVTFFLIVFTIGSFAVGWGSSQLEKYKTIIRFSVFFLFWLASIVATLFYESDGKHFSFKHGWSEWVVRAIGAVVWTIMIYFAAIYGIGLDE